MWLIDCRVMPFVSLGWQRSVVTLHASFYGIRKFTISCDKISHFAARNITLIYAHNFNQMSKCCFIPTMTNFPANSTCPNLSFSKEIFCNAIIYNFNSMFSINKFYNIFCSNSLPSKIIRIFCIFCKISIWFAHFSLGWAAELIKYRKIKIIKQIYIMGFWGFGVLGFWGLGFRV